MGTYATTTSLVILMVGTTFDTATTSLASKMITNSENEVNKYLSKRYDVSLFTGAAIPPLVTTLAENLAEGYMYHRMARGGKDALAHAQSLIKPAIENLKMLAERMADLLDSSGSPISESANSSYKILSNTNTYSPTFNEDRDTQWKSDIDKLDAIEDERD